jgi:F-type H+-transporting ATPase subunit epsilon
MTAARTFPFEIWTFQKAILREEARFVIAPGREGRFEVLPGHAPFLFALEPGVLQIRRPDGTDDFVATGEGLLVVDADRVTALVRTAELREDIDPRRAELARQRAEKRLNDPAPDIDVRRARSSVKRADARLRVKETP